MLQSPSTLVGKRNNCWIDELSDYAVQIAWYEADYTGEVPPYYKKHLHGHFCNLKDCLSNRLGGHIPFVYKDKKSSKLYLLYPITYGQIAFFSILEILFLEIRNV